MYWLLIVSYYFYMSWNVIYGLLILFSTSVTYFCALGLERLKSVDDDSKKKTWRRVVVFSGLLINLGLLFYFKYTNFAIHNLNFLLTKIGKEVWYPDFDIVLPVGISFYTFQALGYMIDVYRGDV